MERFYPRPREGATPQQHRFPRLGLVSIRAPVKGRLNSRSACIRTKCFYPRPREGRHAQRGQVGGGDGVSIRAPVKGRLRVRRWGPSPSGFLSAPP